MGSHYFQLTARASTASITKTSADRLEGQIKIFIAQVIHHEILLPEITDGSVLKIRFLRENKGHIKYDVFVIKILGTNFVLSA